MELCFKPVKKEYLGVGTLPNGPFDIVNEWKPLTKYLESGAQKYPDKLMFKIGNSDGKIIEEYSYLETNQKSNQVANGLIDFGIKKGDKVGMYMLNSAEFVFSILGTHKTGGVQVPINKDEKGERLAYVINYSEMSVLVVDISGLPLIKEISDKLENLNRANLYFFILSKLRKLCLYRILTPNKQCLYFAHKPSLIKRFKTVIERLSCEGSQSGSLM